jgi:hypothetical protein
VPLIYLLSLSDLLKRSRRVAASSQETNEDLVPNEPRRGWLSLEPGRQSGTAFRSNRIHPSTEVSIAAIEPSRYETASLQLLQRLIDLSEVDHPRRPDAILNDGLDRVAVELPITDDGEKRVAQ